MVVKAKAKLASEGPSPQRVSPFWSPLLLQSPSWASADVMDRRLSYDSEGLKLHWPETDQFFRSAANCHVLMAAKGQRNFLPFKACSGEHLVKLRAESQPKVAFW